MNDDSIDRRYRGNGSDHTENTLSRAMELGYRFVEEQIRQSQKITEQLIGGNVDAAQAEAYVSDVTERVIRFYSDVGALWFEMMEPVLRTGALRDMFDDPSSRPSAHKKKYPAEAEPPANTARPEILVEIYPPESSRRENRPGNFESQ